MGKKTEDGPKVNLPFGFRATVDGIVFDDGGEAGPVRVCGPLDVLAETRDDRGSNWGGPVVGDEGGVVQAGYPVAAGVCDGDLGGEHD